MTVTYSLNVSKARLLGFAKLLLRWRGSIYKLLYREMAIFCGLYYSLSALYRYILKESQRTVFEKLALYCEAFTNLIPLSFVLGFYVSIVVSRWWQQFISLPWPDKPCMLISAYVHGRDERGRLIRRTLARYLSLLSVLSFQAVSTAVKKRFPTLDHVEEAGLMTKEERTVYEEISVVHGKWWIPAQWFTALATRARKEGRIKDDVLLSDLLNELHTFRGNCGMLFNFDWISIPLVYTQVVTLAIYTYFMASVMGRQYLNPEKGYPGYEVDLYIPIFTILQFFFYMGWLKVAEQLINPFGEDDDDFELNWCLDRNLVISFLIVDEMCQRHPRLVKDQYWDELEPQLPYTKSSVALRTQPHLGSAVNLDINLDEAEFVPMETIMEDDGEENTYSSPPVSPNTELLYPGFPQPDKPTTPIVDETGSQSGLKGFSDFPGSKFLNMLIGHSSSENVAQTPKKEGSILPTFTLKTPSRKSRTSSQSENTKNSQNDEKDDQELVTMAQASHDVLKNDATGTSVQQSSLIIDIPAGEIHSDGPTDQSEYSVKKSKDTEPTGTVEDCKEGNKMVTFEGDQNQPSKDVVVEIDSASDSPTDQVQSPFEPTLSDESLAVYVESNQSTVSSYAELLGKQV